MELVKGGVYRIRARNFFLAAYDGDGGFIGIREKFGSRYLFKEYHGERFRPFNSVSLVLERVATVPDNVPLVERFFQDDEGRNVAWDRSRKEWRRLDGAEAVGETRARDNAALNEFLQPLADEEDRRFEAALNNPEEPN